jgi:hypothetical protein
MHVRMRGKMQETISRSRPPLSGTVGKVITVLLLAALPLVAQHPAVDATSSKDQFKAGDKSNAGPKVEERPLSGTSNDRLFYALPNFLTMENTGQLPPLTSWQKFKVAARSSFDCVEYPWYGALSGIGQAQNSERGFGQAAAGYAKRYATSFGDGTIENFMTTAILPSLLREDPRFYQSSTGSFSRRTGYAISRIFVTRTDSGHERINFSELIGSALAAGISTYSYHPQADRNLPNAGSVWGTQVGYDTITIVVKEFWPDLRRKLSRKPPPETFAP